MKTIPLTQGKVAIVDDCDYEWLSQWKWYLQSAGYAARHKPKHTDGPELLLMHRELMRRHGTTCEGLDVDHINRCALDNRIENLRATSHRRNTWNDGLRQSNTSGYPGVSWDKSRNRWVSRIRLGGKKKHLGRFDTAEEASATYQLAKAKRDEADARNTTPPSC